jgi:hypothetical protein
LPVFQHPLFRVLAFIIIIVTALLYMPTREFLKITFMLGIPFIFLLGINLRQQRRGVIWFLSTGLLLVVVGAYGYLLIDLPERIEVRRIISTGGALVAEGSYDEAIMEYRKLGDPESPEEVERVLKLVDDIHLLAIEMEGSTTGEHGVGAVRRSYAEKEHGLAVKYMRGIKEVFDPRGIMNPEKLF